MITLFNCPLQNKFQDAWSDCNYFIYVMEGRKIWHTTQGSFDLRAGDCVFVRKGSCIIEQFLDTTSCFIFFFMPDKFIYDVLKSKANPVTKRKSQFRPVISLNDNERVQLFFQSMLQFFHNKQEPDKALLELKFRELILTLADDTSNNELQSYFFSLLHRPKTLTLQEVMEENFCFNLKLDEFARLSARSLSAFKRDFQSIYQTTPGKWLLEKRLDHGLHLLTNLGKSVSEAAFESGFESASHFSRAFRERFGSPPALLRRLELA